MKNMGDKKLRDHIMTPGHNFETCRECLLRLKARGIKTIVTIHSLKNPAKDIRQSVDELLAKI